MANEFIALILWQITILFRNLIHNYQFISSKYVIHDVHWSVGNPNENQTEPLALRPNT